jgi:hypothetical protein
MKSGLWGEVMDLLVRKTRLNAGRGVGLSYCLIDSQSVKTISGFEDRGLMVSKKLRAANDIL